MNKITRIYRILKRQKRPFCYLFAVFLLKTKLCNFFTINTRGYKIRFSPSSLATVLFCYPDDRKITVDFIANYLSKGETYIDVGSNIGVTAIPGAKSVGKEGVVLAFEPHPLAYRYMCNNLEFNQINYVNTINAALGEKEGMVSFSNINADDQNKVLTQKAKNAIEVPINTLDHYTANLNKVDLLKIDVEGYEKFVLEGSSKTLEKTKSIYIEISVIHFKEFNYTAKDIFTKLENQGFDLFRIVSEKKLEKINTLYVQEVVSENIVATKNINKLVKQGNWEIVETSFVSAL